MVKMLACSFYPTGFGLGFFEEDLDLTVAGLVTSLSKTLFSLNPGVTRDSRVTPGLPLDLKTGHESFCWIVFACSSD